MKSQILITILCELKQNRSLSPQQVAKIHSQKEGGREAVKRQGTEASSFWGQLWNSIPLPSFPSDSRKPKTVSESGRIRKLFLWCDFFVFGGGGQNPEEEPKNSKGRRKNSAAVASFDCRKAKENEVFSQIERAKTGGGLARFSAHCPPSERSRATKNHQDTDTVSFQFPAVLLLLWRLFGKTCSKHYFWAEK